MKHECVLRLSSFVTDVFHQQTSRCSRALVQANEHHAPARQLPSTTVPPRRQPSLHPCDSRSVMGCLGMDSSSQPHDDQTSTMPLASTTAVPAHQLSPFAISLPSWQTPRPFCLVQRTGTDQAPLAQSVDLSLSSVLCERCWR